ncbi:MAG: GHKL domain-containing protein [Candidatus Omnitrophica bacterium]|nr:GHKL domain-containing protein [Candidatus Omnitrophota bacterium]
MRPNYLKLTHKIAGAFAVLGLVVAIAGGVGLHYLEGVRVHQLQFEDEWSEYQRMVAAEDALKTISTDISAWQAGILPVDQLKSRSGEIKRILSSWARGEQEEKKRQDLFSHEKEEARLLAPARQAFGELTEAIDNCGAGPTISAAAPLIRALERLQSASRPLREFYFESIRTSLAKAQKARLKAEEGGLYFIVIVALLILGISTYSIQVLRRQTKQLMEQERQIALVALVQHLTHEIRNPLGIVKSAASVIARRSTGEVVTLANDISSEVERVDGLLTDLLHLHRGADKPKVPTDISAIVVRVAELFASKVQAAGLRLEVQNKAAGVLLPCHPEAIKQVVMNLLLNAIEASSEKSTIEVATMVAGQEYLLQVRDQGVGLDREQRARIFDLMYTTKPYGFGIGLTVVKRIVEDHGGRIEVADAPSHGTIFTIYLPIRT